MITIRSVPKTVVATAAAALLGGCASTLPFPEETLGSVDRSITLARLRHEPAAHLDAWVLLGGRIVATRARPEQTEIEVLGAPLRDDGRPMDTARSEGRFLIVTPESLDPAEYAVGRRLTVLGQVSGEERRPVDDRPHLYPIVTAEHLRLWVPGADPASYRTPYPYGYPWYGYPYGSGYRYRYWYPYRFDPHFSRGYPPHFGHGHRHHFGRGHRHRFGPFGHHPPRHHRHW